jgi:hypothetical protein
LHGEERIVGAGQSHHYNVKEQASHPGRDAALRSTSFQPPRLAICEQ